MKYCVLCLTLLETCFVVAIMEGLVKAGRSTKHLRHVLGFETWSREDPLFHDSLRQGSFFSHLSVRTTSYLKLSLFSSYMFSLETGQMQVSGNLDNTFGRLLLECTWSLSSKRKTTAVDGLHCGTAGLRG